MFVDCERSRWITYSLLGRELTSGRAARYYVQAGKQLGESWDLQKVGEKDVKQWDAWVLGVGLPRLCGARSKAELICALTAARRLESRHRRHSGRLRHSQTPPRQVCRQEALARLPLGESRRRHLDHPTRSHGMQDQPAPSQIQWCALFVLTIPAAIAELTLRSHE